MRKRLCISNEPFCRRKWKDVVGRTTVNSDTVVHCISIDPTKGEDFSRTEIKRRCYWCRFADADPPKPPEECEHVSKGKAGDGVIYVDDKGRNAKLDVKRTCYEIGIDGRRGLQDLYTSRCVLSGVEEDVPYR